MPKIQERFVKLFIGNRTTLTWPSTVTYRLLTGCSNLDSFPWISAPLYKGSPPILTPSHNWIQRLLSLEGSGIVTVGMRVTVFRGHANKGAQSNPEFVSHYAVLYNSWRRNLYCPGSLQVIKFKHQKPGGNNMVAFNPEFHYIWDQGENRCCKVLPPPECRSHVISQFHFVSRILPFCKTRLQFLGSLHAEAYSRRWVQVWTRSNVIAINHHPEYLDLFLAS